MTDQLLVRSLIQVFRSMTVDIPLEVRLGKIDAVVKYMVKYISDKENLFFSSYFSRISFLSNKYSFSGKGVFLFHTFRKLFPLNSKIEEHHYTLGLYVLNELVSKCLDVQLEVNLEEFDSSLYSKVKSGNQSFIPHLKVYFEGYDKERDQIVTVDDNKLPIQIDFADSRLKDELCSFLRKLEQWDRLPIKGALFDISLEDGRYNVTYYVLEPDFLIDVTSVSEAFDAFGVSVSGYGLRKIVDKSATLSLHIGNISNVILDELIYDPSISYTYFLNKIFKISPLSFALFTNEQVRQLMDTVKQHYTNIKKVIDTDFDNLDINGPSVYVEPTFYAPKIGIQGRFDLLHHHGNEMNIIELKSGKSYKPNTYGLNNSHYHQTLLYDMILESNLGKGIKRNNFILYSAESEQSLRYAPTVKSEQREALRVRNRIYMEEISMQHSTPDEPYLANYIRRYDGKLFGFKLQDLKVFKKLYGSSNEVERAYWEAAFAFLSREYALSKIGDELSERNKGLSGLWQLSDAQKKQRFLLIDKLTIEENKSETDDPSILMKYSADTALLNNFRVGDIVLLYPTDSLRDNRISSQIFKCTISKIGSGEVLLRLRSRQMNEKAFVREKHWSIEHDILDSSFSKTFRQLFHFGKAEKDKKAKILGIKPPDEYINQKIKKDENTTDHQHTIIEKAISCLDYQLIWGPPGTGKTSYVLREIIKHYYQKTTTRLLVMAYTNRAVDEICAAMDTISDDIDYIRIGSSYSCGQNFKDHLLNERLKSITDRKSLKELLSQQKIYVGTLASIIGKPELFDLLQFGVGIVDEASQILEPSLVGIFSKLKKFILIGDHVQLPAIVLQNTKQALIKDENLVEAGFQSFSDSLFERLYNQAMTNSWDWGYSQLQEQARMHVSIMDFVNDQFYKDRLSLLHGIERLESNRGWTVQNDEQQHLIENRLVFISAKHKERDSNEKVSHTEAHKVVVVMNAVIDLLERNNIPITNDSIGIITPFRAQIALINEQIQQDGNLAKYNFSVDTVERYQGSARDIVIISTVVNSHFHLDSIVSENRAGVDRKLNVAISRAREQVILVGNDEILAESPYYKAFLEASYHLKI